MKAGGGGSSSAGGPAMNGFPGGFSSFGAGGAPFTFHMGGPGVGAGFRPSAAEDIFKQFFGASFGGPGGSPFMDMDEDFGGGPRFRGAAGGMPGGFFPGAAAGGGKRAGGGAAPGFEQTVTRKLPVSLEDLYSGTTKKLKISRKRSDGNTEKIVELNIKPGWKAGTKVTFNGEGDQLPNGQYQDIQFVIEEKAHSQFKRQGDNLLLDLSVTLAEALTGFSKLIGHLDGRRLEVTGAQGTSTVKPNDKIVLRGEGMPVSKYPGKKGDLIINVQIQFPHSLNSIQKNNLQQILS